jgi:uncharacterized low-complexity protein
MQCGLWSGDEGKQDSRYVCVNLLLSKTSLQVVENELRSHVVQQSQVLHNACQRRPVERCACQRRECACGRARKLKSRCGLECDENCGIVVREDCLNVIMRAQEGVNAGGICQWTSGW